MSIILLFFTSGNLAWGSGHQKTITKAKKVVTALLDQANQSKFCKNVKTECLFKLQL